MVNCISSTAILDRYSESRRLFATALSLLVMKMLTRKISVACTIAITVSHRKMFFCSPMYHPEEV